MPSNPDNKILARIVKGIQAEEEDPLTPLIDEYLLKRNKPKYRSRRLQEITLPLIDRPRPGGRLSPSAICGCERQAALKFMGVEGKFRIDPDTELIFEDGHWRHHKWGTMFLDMERVLGRHRFRVLHIEFPCVIDGLYVAGHLDVEIKIKVGDRWIRYVVDFKGSNNYAFEQAYRDRAPHPTYVKQLLTYMKARKCKRGILLYDSKDKNKFYVFVIKANDQAWAEVRLWCKKVIRQMREGVLPERHPDCQNGNFLYSRCQYRSMCWGERSQREIQREVFIGFPGVKKLWEKGHAEIEEHSGYEA